MLVQIGTNYLDLAIFELRVLGLKADWLREKSRGAPSRDLSPGGLVNVLVALGSPGSGLELLAR